MPKAEKKTKKNYAGQLEELALDPKEITRLKTLILQTQGIDLDAFGNNRELVAAFVLEEYRKQIKLGERQSVINLLDINSAFQRILEEAQDTNVDENGIIYMELTNEFLNYLDVKIDTTAAEQDSFFARSNKLINHDLQNLTGSLRLILSRRNPNEEKYTLDLTESQYNNFIDTLHTLITFIQFIAQERSKEENTSSEDMLIPITETALLSTFPERDRGKIKILNIMQFSSIEEFFSVRTLVLNALAAGATEVKIDQKIENGEERFLMYFVYDDANVDARWQDYIVDLEQAFNEGFMNPKAEYSNDRGGGKMAAFLSGQRARIHINQDEISPEMKRLFLDYSPRLGDDLKTAEKFISIGFAF